MMQDNRINGCQEEEIDLLDYLIILLKRKKLILGITMSAAITTVIISFVMAPVYRAETKILPPKQGGPGMASDILSRLGGAAVFLDGAADIKTSGELYVGMLKSRTVLDRIVERFNLVEVYGSEIREDARQSLLGVLKADVDMNSGLITIGVEDREPRRSAEMANAFVKELKELNKGLAVTEASQRRLFFEEQLEDAREELIRAEESMMQFQEKTGAIRIDEQAKAVLEGITQLKAQIAAKEVELKVMKTYATPQNPDLQRTKEELGGLLEQMKRLEVKDSAHNPYSLLPTGTIPSVGTEYVRKLREFKYQESLYEILLKQYEAARLDESMSVAVIQVIDEAVPPQRTVKPKRIAMISLATLSGFLISVFAAFFMEYVGRVSEDTSGKEKIGIIKRYLAFQVDVGSQGRDNEP